MKVKHCCFWLRADELLSGASQVTAEPLFRTVTSRKTAGVQVSVEMEEKEVLSNKSNTQDRTDKSAHKGTHYNTNNTTNVSNNINDGNRSNKS